MYWPDAPEPPVVSEVHATSCTVTYQPPRDDGGAPVTGYILERRTAGTNKWIRVKDTLVTDVLYTIDNLTPDTQYEFRVAVVNKAGMSDFSIISSKIMTGEKPDKPGLPEVTVDATDNSVRLQWTAPSSNGGADITEYIVRCRTSDERKDITVPVDTITESLISYTIRKQLQVHTLYRFAVAAVNKVGRGPWSDMTEEIKTYSGTLHIIWAIETKTDNRKWQCRHCQSRNFW